MGSGMAALLLNGPSTASISLMLCLFKQHLNFAGIRYLHHDSFSLTNRRGFPLKVVVAFQVVNYNVKGSNRARCKK